MAAFRSGNHVTQQLEQTSPMPAPLPPTPYAHEEEGDTILGLLVGGFLSIAAGIFAFGIVAGIVAAIIVPPWYRSLEPRYQVIWCERISLLCELQAERDTDDVYRLDGSESQADEALTLLATATPSLEPTQAPSPTIPVATEAVIDPTPPTATPIPPTATPTPSVTPSPTPIPLPEIAKLELNRIKWEQQAWNNCGPTTITMGLTYFGYTNDQKRAQQFLKPNVEDTNVSPSQMVAFVNSQRNSLGVEALYRVGGTSEILKLLIANDFPVIIERGIQVEDTGWMGHYSLLVGYDESTREYLLFDSYMGYGRGEGRRFTQQSIEAGWKEFNYTFIVLYNLNRLDELSALLGDYANPTTAANIARGIALSEATANPDDKWAWFNLGSSLTLLGDYENAVKAYDYARTLNLPFRMMWYQFGPYMAYYEVGRYDDVLSLALASEKTTPYIEETYYYRGLVYAAQGKVDSAIFQFDKSIQYNSNFTPAADAKQAVLEGRPIVLDTSLH